MSAVSRPGMGLKRQDVNKPRRVTVFCHLTPSTYVSPRRKDTRPLPISQMLRTVPSHEVDVLAHRTRQCQLILQFDSPPSLKIGGFDSECHVISNFPTLPKVNVFRRSFHTRIFEVFISQQNISRFLTDKIAFSYVTSATAWRCSLVDFLRAESGDR
ncbi:hypothetical protein BGX38DRAFT_613591 [Terfezia claveryi]|nr:hypothetical protein BGX38DRAFT_613591 [Terfezia claveryi]